MKKINQYKTTYYKELGAFIGLVFVLITVVIPSYVNDENLTYVREEEKHVEVKKEIKKEETLEDKIRKHFPRSHFTMIAIAHAESHMNPAAKNWNCFYNKQFTDSKGNLHKKGSIVYTEPNSHTYSTSCQVQHRKYAWSVDCFVLQRNYIGQKCPTNVTVDEHLEDVAKLSKIQGLNAWSSYNNGLYKKYLSSN